MATLVVLALATAQAAPAATITARLNIAATVRANCVLRSPVGLDFGTYHPNAQSPSAIDASAPVLTIQCTKGSPGVRIALDNGAAYADAHRNLLDEQNDRIPYEIYTAADRATVWSQDQPVEYVAQTGAPSSIAMYGRVFAPKAAPRPGSYSDTLLASVNF